MNDHDLDIDIERRLRGWYRGGFTDAVHTPEALRDSVAAIPRTVPAVRPRMSRRGRTALLAAAAVLVVAGGVAVSGYLSPAPSVFVIAPSPSPAPTASPSDVAPSQAPSDDPAVEPSLVPTVAPSFVPVDAPPVAASWRPAGSMATARVAHIATLLTDGRVLVAGGATVDGVAVSSAELWDPRTHTFTATGAMHVPRIGGAATLLPDGRVLVVGGDGRGSATASAEIWDPTTGTFGPEIRTPDNRGSGLTATLLTDGRVLVIGGVRCFRPQPQNAPSCDDPLATLIWDPAASGTFEFGPRLHESRDWGSTVLLSDGRVLVVGGTGQALDTPESAEVWDPRTSAFERVGEPHDYRSGGLSATLLPDGRVMIAGGDTGDLSRNDAWFGPLGSAEVWDPGIGLFDPAGSMATVRSGHQAGLLTDGQVIVVGGSAERSADFVDTGLATTEVWDPTDGSFHAGPSMEVGRRAFTLTRLADGTYLAIGGASRISRGEVVDVVATAEQLGSFAP